MKVDTFISLASFGNNLTKIVLLKKQQEKPGGNVKKIEKRLALICSLVFTLFNLGCKSNAPAWPGSCWRQDCGGETPDANPDQFYDNGLADLGEDQVGDNAILDHSTLDEQGADSVIDDKKSDASLADQRDSDRREVATDQVIDKMATDAVTTDRPAADRLDALDSTDSTTKDTTDAVVDFQPTDISNDSSFADRLDVSSLDVSNELNADRTLTADQWIDYALDASDEIIADTTSTDASAEICQITFSATMPKPASSPRVAASQTGFALSWYDGFIGTDPGVMRTYDWSGAVASPDRYFENAGQLTGGIDNYILMYGKADDPSFPVRYRGIPVTHTGTVGSPILLADLPGTLPPPVVLFDGANFQATYLQDRTSIDCAGTTLYTGKFSPTAFVNEGSWCHPSLNLSDVKIGGVRPKDGRLLVGLRYALDGSPYGGQIYVVNFLEAKTWKPVDVSASSGTSLLLQALGQADGHTSIAWQYGATNYHSPLDDLTGERIVDYTLPLNHTVVLAGGNELVGIYRNTALNSVEFWRATSRGSIMNRLNLSTPSKDVAVLIDADKNGHYVVVTHDWTDNGFYFKTISCN